MHSIQTASELTGVAKDMIRHYEKLGLITPQRGENNYRAFAEDDLLRLVLVRYLNNLGLGLKELTAIFRDDDIGCIVSRLRAETARLEQLQKYIAARTAATRTALSGFEQCHNGTPPAIVPVKRRFLYSRDKNSPEDYCRLCQRFTQVSCFYQYYHLQQVTLENGRFRLEDQDVGILLYDPLPFALPGAVELQAQRYYQATMRMPRGTYLAQGDLLPHLVTAASHGESSRFFVLTYQLFESNAADHHSVICIEIPLEHRALDFSEMPSSPLP